MEFNLLFKRAELCQHCGTFCYDGQSRGICPSCGNPTISDVKRRGSKDPIVSVLYQGQDGEDWNEIVITCQSRLLRHDDYRRMISARENGSKIRCTLPFQGELNRKS